MQRRIAAVLVIIVGLAFIVATFNESLFSVGNAFEDLSDDFRPIMQDDALDGLSEDVAGLAAVSDEFRTVVIPTISGALQMSPEDFNAFMGQEFPAVATGVQALPDITTTFGGLVETLRSQQDLFASADAIPTTSLPAQSVPVGLVLSGIVALLLGGWMLIRPSTGKALAVLLFGAAIVVASFVLSLPGKSDAADQLNANLEPFYTAETIEGGKQALAIVGAMGEEIQTSMLPALGQQLSMDGDQLNAFFGENFPATAQGLQVLPEALGRFQNVIATFDANLENYNTLKPAALHPIAWLLAIGGIVFLVAGAWALVAGRTKEESPAASDA